MEQLIFEDLDHEFLYDEDPSRTAAATDYLRAAHLPFREWFLPFRGPYAALYVVDDD